MAWWDMVLFVKFEDDWHPNKAEKPWFLYQKMPKYSLKLINSTAFVVAITSVGRMLIFPAQDLPALLCKGNKIHITIQVLSIRL